MNTIVKGQLFVDYCNDFGIKFPANSVKVKRWCAVCDCQLTGKQKNCCGGGDCMKEMNKRRVATYRKRNWGLCNERSREYQRKLANQRRMDDGDNGE